MDRSVVFLDLKGGCAPCDKPLMLRPILFCPVLTWVAQELTVCGAQRFFIVCDEARQDEVREAMEGFDTRLFASAQEALADAEGEVIVVPSPVVPVYGPEDSRSVYAAEVGTLKARLESGIPLTDCPAEACGIRSLWQTQTLPPVFRPVADEAALSAAMPDARELLLRRMTGVTVVDPATTYIDPRCSIAPGVTLLPGTILRGHTAIGSGCEIGPNAMIRDCTVGDRTEVNASQCNESTIGSDTHVGPFAYIRPHCTVGDHIKVGDFVELKNSSIGDGTKISHLTYVGDSDVGQKVNFRCGTITTNYDGFRKFRCDIGDGAFIGCNTNLVAPVKIGAGAYTAAGSTVTRDVPPDALHIARPEETIKEGWAKRRRQAHGKD